ncbi:Flp pilus assembly protein TadG [Jannaschia faecimaris]|uniref:Flp pilus assembly protein TadG n=1 Tax=Jannaschia faecimaris TaxID=1244108 RepID=A0A1H3TKX7_9RHOB|nr:pilus assembly protein TadG-related protein [Jannaschia faecimaris]SDZ50914.1 Flp pilus assembly protein TadG [Jannaschia faecimaris]
MIRRGPFTPQRLARFAADESGSILVLWIMSLVAILGITALVFDMGRIQIAQTDLKRFAENVALAAAAELDGQDDSITRATNAADVLISNPQAYGGDGTLFGAADYTLTFLDGLPAEDVEPDGTPTDTSPFLTTNSSEAIFAQVVATPATLATPFLQATRAILGTGGATQATVSGQAIAGFTMEACDVTPLMFCKPPGWSATQNTSIGDQILLRSGGQGTAWGPGDFGFLDVTAGSVGSTCQGLSGAKLIGCLIGAEDNITRCYSEKGVTTEPGQKVGLMNAVFNTRFDQFSSVMSTYKNDPNYTAAPNTISGIIPSGSCGWNSTTASTNSIGLPQDDCFSATGGCTRFGDGTWDYDTYIDTNHGDANGVLDVGEDSHLLPHIPAAYAGTRYGVYVAEIENAKTAGLPNGAILDGRDEAGTPQCTSNVSTNPKRRVLIAAAVDCVANPINGSASNVPVAEFVEIFMTNPVGEGVGSPPSFDLWVEVIGSAGVAGYSSAGTGGVFRDVVQLYR